MTKIQVIIGALYHAKKFRFHTKGLSRGVTQVQLYFRMIPRKGMWMVAKGTKMNQEAVTASRQEMKRAGTRAGAVEMKNRKWIKEIFEM